MAISSISICMLLVKSVEERPARVDWGSKSIVENASEFSWSRYMHSYGGILRWILTLCFQHHLATWMKVDRVYIAGCPSLQVKLVTVDDFTSARELDSEEIKKHAEAWWVEVRSCAVIYHTVVLWSPHRYGFFRESSTFIAVLIVQLALVLPGFHLSFFRCVFCWSACALISAVLMAHAMV